MKRTFSAQIDQLRPLLQWIAEPLLQAGFDRAALRKVEVASEEAFVNIVQHAYAQKGGSVEVELRISPNEFVEIVLRDWGPPFDPSRHAEVPSSEGIGGLGIPFMHHCVDTVTYHRESDANILTLKKIWTNRSSRKK